MVRLKWGNQDGIGLAVISHHHILVATASPDRESTTVVHVYFVDTGSTMLCISPVLTGGKVGSSARLGLGQVGLGGA